MSADHVLDLGLDIVNGVRWLDLKGDGLAGEGLDENLRRTERVADARAMSDDCAAAGARERATCRVPCADAGDWPLAAVCKSARGKPLSGAVRK